MAAYKDGMTLGEALKAQRTSLGLRQRDVAIRLAVDQGTISKWENEDQFPDARYVARLAEFLDLEPGKVYELAAAQASSSRLQQRAAIPAAASGVDISDLAPKDQQFVRELVDRLRRERGSP